MLGKYGLCVLDIVIPFQYNMVIKNKNICQKNVCTLMLTICMLKIYINKCSVIDTTCNELGQQILTDYG